MTDRTVGETFFIAFTTRAFATGIPTVLAGSPVVSAYEDAGLTQITAGITLGVDHDSVVGLNMLTIVATGANGYEAGKDYQMVITVGTVDSVSVVGEVVGSFSLGLSAAFTRLGAPAGASVSADVLVIDNFVDGLESTIGAAGAGLTDLGGMSTGMKAEVNVEAKDVLFTDTDAEPGQGTPAATTTLAAKIGYLYKGWRNRSNQTSSSYQLYADDTTTVDQKVAVSDDGTTAEKGEVATGP